MEPRWEDFRDGPPRDCSVESLRAEFRNRLYAEGTMTQESKVHSGWHELEGMMHYLGYGFTLRIEMDEGSGYARLKMLTTNGWQDLHYITLINQDKQVIEKRLKEYATQLFCLNAK